MAKKKGSTPPNNRGLSSEDIEYLEYFYSLPIDEQTALLVERGSDPKFIARNIMRNKETTKLEPIRLQRLTETEDSVICNYRLLDKSGRKLIAGTLARVIASQVSEAQGCNVTPLRGFNEPDYYGGGEPTSLQRLSGMESDLMHAYRVMDSETKEAVGYLFSSYLESSYLEDGAPCGGNVVSIRR